MKKILFLIHTLNGGGAEKVLVNLVKGLDKDKYQITVMTIVNEGIYIDELKKLPNVTYRYIFNSFFKKYRLNKGHKYNKIAIKCMNKIWKGYRSFIKNHNNRFISSFFIHEKYDVEIAFLEGMCAKIISNSANKHSKKIAWIHTDLTKLKKSSNAFKNEEEEIACYKKFDNIICVSKGVKKAFIQKMGFSDRVEVKLNPINSNEIIESAKERIEDVVRPDGFLICSVGRLIKEKGYDRLLNIHKRLLNEGLYHHLWIIGEGKERENLEKFIQVNKLENTAHLLGFKENPHKYVKASDLFACSSRVEGMSTVLCEAIILQKPIVTTRCPGVTELLGKTNEYAFITENDENDLYEALKLVISNPDIYQKYLKRVREKSNMFVIKEQIKEIEELL